MRTSRPLLPGATCAFPEKLDHDTTIAKGCVVDVVKSAFVEGPVTLTIEEGAKLRFHPGTFLEVGHRGSRLVAMGSEREPVVLTSAAEVPRPGDWVGIVLDGGDAREGTILDHVVVEYAGQPTHGGAGAITVIRAFAPGNVSILRTLFRHNATAAIANPFDAARFGALEDDVFVDNLRALRASAGVLTSAGERNEIDDPIDVLGGSVTTAGAFPRTKAPFIVLGPITVKGERAKLTLHRGTTMRFTTGTWLEVGTGGPGALDAVGVTFTSASPAPAPGDWVGLLFGEGSNPSRVVDCVIEYAGQEERGGDGAITFTGKTTWQGLDVSVLFVRFHAIAQAQISDNGEGCNKGIDPRNGNVFTGGSPACR
jgi:hypothetical protein